MSKPNAIMEVQFCYKNLSYNIDRNLLPVNLGIIGTELIVMDKEAEEVEVPGDLSPISTHPLQKR